MAGLLMKRLPELKASPQQSSRKSCQEAASEPTNNKVADEAGPKTHDEVFTEVLNEAPKPKLPAKLRRSGR